MKYFLVIFFSTTLQLLSAIQMESANDKLYLGVSQELNDIGYMYFDESGVYEGNVSNIFNFMCSSGNSNSLLYWKDNSNFTSEALMGPIYLTVYPDKNEPSISSITCIDSSKSMSILLKITPRISGVNKRCGTIVTKNIEFYEEGSRIVAPEWCYGTLLHPSGEVIPVKPGDIITDFVTENINGAKLLCVSYNRTDRTDRVEWERRVHYKVTYLMVNDVNLMKHDAHLKLILSSIIVVLVLVLLSIILYLCAKRSTSNRNLSPSPERRQSMYREIVWRKDGAHGYRQSEHLYCKIPVQKPEPITSMNRPPPPPGDKNSSTAPIYLNASFCP